MDTTVCELCLSSTGLFRENCDDGTLQALFDQFCALIFQDGTISLDRVCVDCWDSLDQFNDFCDRIRKAHTDYAELHEASDDKESLDHEELDDDDDSSTKDMLEHEMIVVQEEALELYSSLSEEETPVEPPTRTIMTIDPDSFSGYDQVPIRRPNQLTPPIIARLEAQLDFRSEMVLTRDIDFENIARFINTDCNICQQPLDSFEESHKHYLEQHKRNAFWMCCKLLLDTPFDIKDHIKYHEVIDIFQCAACSKCFLSSNKLRYHIRRTHLTHDGPLDCNICDKPFRSQRLLGTHQRSHVRLDCPFCKRIITSANYETHVKMNHVIPTKGESSKAQPKRPVTDSAQMAAKRARFGTVQNQVIFLGPNEDGMFACDKCGMQFKQQSLAFTHRNKVHV